MTVDSSWPAVGSMVTLLTAEGATRARVVAYGKGMVRLAFDDARFNTWPRDNCGPAHRKLYVSTFLRMVRLAAGGLA